MDTDDRLDLLLERSAPAAIVIDSALMREMHTVSHATSAHVTAERPATRRTHHLAAGVGLAVLLSAGGGAAFATGGFDWLPWVQDPDVAYAFTLPSGRGCEARIVLDQTEEYGDWATFVTEIGKIRVDEGAVERRANAMHSNPNSTVQVLDSQGQLQDATAQDRPDDDDWYLAAHYAALTDATTELSSQAGIDGWWTSDAQVQCEAVAP